MKQRTGRKLLGVRLASALLELVACFAAGCSTTTAGYTCGPGTTPINGQCEPAADDASGDASSQSDASTSESDAASDTQGPTITLGALCATDQDCSLATVPAPLSGPESNSNATRGWVCSAYGCSFVCAAATASGPLPTPTCGSISCSQVCTELGGTCVPLVSGALVDVCRKPI